jgi:hypothetical protein
VVSFDASNPGRATFVPGDGTGYLYFFNKDNAFWISLNSSKGDLESGWVEAQVKPASSAPFTDAYIAGSYMLGQMPIINATQNGNVGVFKMDTSGNVSGTISTAGEGDFSFDQSNTMTYSWDSTATGTGGFLMAQPGSSSGKGASCFVISPTKSVCTLQSDSSPSVLILQQ